MVDELAVQVAGIGAFDVGRHAFLHVAAPTDRARVAEFQVKLGDGESEALALAIERRAEFVLIDDAAARHMAKRVGLTPMGVLGVLVRAKEIGVVPTIAPLLDRLDREMGFRLSDKLRRQTLELAGE